MSGGRPIGTKRFRKKKSPPDKPPLEQKPPAQRKSIGDWLGTIGDWLGTIVMGGLVLAGIMLVLIVFSCIASIFSCIEEGAKSLETRMEQARQAIEQQQETDKQEETPEEKATEKKPQPPPREEIEAWFTSHGKPKASDGWEEMGSVVEVKSDGAIGFRPVINTTFWDGYRLEVKSGGTTERPFGLSQNHIYLVGSDGRTTLKVGGPGSNLSSAPTITDETRLVWLKRVSVSNEAGEPREYTVKIVEPQENSDLVQQMRRGVCYSYHRTFTGKDSKGVRFCSLPLQLVGTARELIRINFDLDVTLARAPEPSETTVTDPSLDTQLLGGKLGGAGAVMLVWAAGNGEFVERMRVSDWHVRLSSEESLRVNLPGEYLHTDLYADFWFKSEIPVDIFVAVRMRSTP